MGTRGAPTPIRNTGEDMEDTSGFPVTRATAAGGSERQRGGWIDDADLATLLLPDLFEIWVKTVRLLPPITT